MRKVGIYTMEENMNNYENTAAMDEVSEPVTTTEVTEAETTEANDTEESGNSAAGMVVFGAICAAAGIAAYKGGKWLYGKAKEAWKTRKDKKDNVIDAEFEEKTESDKEEATEKK